MGLMKPYFFALMMLLFAVPAHCQSTYDVHQDDRFNNYIVADSVLSGQITSELSGIKWILGTIAGAIIVGLIGAGVARVMKKR